MAFRQKVIAAVRATLQLPLVSTVVHHRRVRQAVRRIPALQRLYENKINLHGFSARHPFDRVHGTDTSGLIRDLATHTENAARGVGRFFYGGSQPSIVRSVMRVLPPLDSYTFVDLGCGKGRVLMVAAEFSFRDILGVEFSESLAEVGRANVALVRRRFPQRVPIRIECADATTFRMPAGNLVVYLYNPFGEDIISRVASNIESAIAAENPSVFVVYYNPLYGHCFDASRSLKRFFAEELPYAPEELGFGPNDSECVVIWQSVSEHALAPLPGADDAFEVIIPGSRAKMLSTPAR